MRLICVYSLGQHIIIFGYHILDLYFLKLLHILVVQLFDGVYVGLIEDAAARPLHL